MQSVAGDEFGSYSCAWGENFGGGGYYNHENSVVQHTAWRRTTQSTLNSGP